MLKEYLLFQQNQRKIIHNNEHKDLNQNKLKKKLQYDDLDI